MNIFQVAYNSAAHHHPLLFLSRDVNIASLGGPQHYILRLIGVSFVVLYFELSWQKQKLGQRVQGKPNFHPQLPSNRPIWPLNIKSPHLGALNGSRSKGGCKVQCKQVHRRCLPRQESLHTTPLLVVSDSVRKCQQTC